MRYSPHLSQRAGAEPSQELASSAGSSAGACLELASDWIATRGSRRSSQAGRAHVVRPRSSSTAGSRIILITIASRETIARVAVELFAKQGYDHTMLAEIA